MLIQLDSLKATLNEVSDRVGDIERIMTRIDTLENDIEGIKYDIHTPSGKFNDCSLPIISVCLNWLSDRSVRKSDVIVFNLQEEDKSVNTVISDFISKFFLNLIRLF